MTETKLISYLHSKTLVSFQIKVLLYHLVNLLGLIIVILPFILAEKVFHLLVIAHTIIFRLLIWINFIIVITIGLRSICIWMGILIIIM